MNNKIHGLTVWMKSTIVALGAVFVVGAVSQEARPATMSGETTVTGQRVSGNTESAKFEEYRTVPNGVYVENLDFEVAGDENGNFLGLRAYKPGLRDQFLGVNVGKLGLARFDLSYNEQPHIYSTAGRSPFVYDGAGNLRLPDQLQTNLQASTSNATAAFTDLPFVDLGTQRDTVAGRFSITPVDRLQFNIFGSNEDRSGTIRRGAYFSNPVEFAEPVSYRTNTFGTSAEYSDGRFTAVFGYNGSIFHNDLRTATVDNPWRLAPSIPSAAGASTTDRINYSLPPDNQAHNFNLASGINLPFWSSRVNAGVSYGWMNQNEDFVPPTANQNLLITARNLGIDLNPAQKSLEGVIRTMSANASLNMRPLQPLGVAVKARYYKFDNDTPELLFSQYVPYDSSISTFTPTSILNPTRTRKSIAPGYEKWNAGTSVNYRVLSSLNATVGYDYERMDRQERAVGRTHEHTVSASVNYVPKRWIELRPSYAHSLRYYDHYEEELVTEEGIPLGEGVNALGQMEELRMFDMANRLRDVVGVKMSVYPIDSVTVDVDYQFRMDDYMDSEFGTQSEKNHGINTELTYEAFDFLTLNGGYGYEENTTVLKNRYRESGNATRPPFDMEFNDWQTHATDRTDSFNVGANGVIIKDKLVMDAGYTFDRSRGELLSDTPNGPQVNPTTGTGDGIGQQQSVTAADFPETKSELHTFSTALKWHLLENLTARLSYRYEHYLVSDFEWTTLQVWQPTWNNALYLAAAEPNYDAHIVALSLILKFGS